MKIVSISWGSTLTKFKVSRSNRNKLRVPCSRPSRIVPYVHSWLFPLNLVPIFGELQYNVMIETAPYLLSTIFPPVGLHFGMLPGVIPGKRYELVSPNILKHLFGSLTYSAFFLASSDGVILLSRCRSLALVSWLPSINCALAALSLCCKIQVTSDDVKRGKFEWWCGFTTDS